MPEQLALDLPHRAAFEADDFLVSDCNAAAVRLIDDWPQWPSFALAIVGPEGSGKTHLATVWRLKSGAVPVRPGEGMWSQDGRTGARAVLLEDIDRAGWQESTLFHWLNLCRESGASVLLTSRLAPAQIDVALPDLASRLRSLPTVTIGAPDDVLLRAVLLKQFSDRQLDVEPHVIAYLSARMERSMATARRLVEELDRASLAAGRAITRALAGEVLARIDARPREGAAEGGE